MPETIRTTPRGENAQHKWRLRIPPPTDFRLPTTDYSAPKGAIVHGQKQASVRTIRSGFVAGEMTAGAAGRVATCGRRRASEESPDSTGQGGG
jgi:hypothetical protein